MIHCKVIFQKRFNREPVEGYVTECPDFKKPLQIFLDREHRHSVIVRGKEVDHYQVINEVLLND